MVIYLLYYTTLLLFSFYDSPAVQWNSRQWRFGGFAESWCALCLWHISLVISERYYLAYICLELNIVWEFHEILYEMWDTLGYYKIWAEKHWLREWLLNSDSCWVNRLSHLTSINPIFLICKTKLSADLLHSSGWQLLGKYREWASPYKGLTLLRTLSTTGQILHCMAWKILEGRKWIQISFCS